MAKNYDVVVIGSGPGGYVAAIRASQLGLSAALIERGALGGICLNWGCIPTKVLIRSAEVFGIAKRAGEFGVLVNAPVLDFARVTARKEEVVSRLKQGVAFLLKTRKIDFIKGSARFTDKNRIDVAGEVIEAKHFIIATGARPRELPNMKFDKENILSSDDILEFKALPESLIIVGGGVIGCEYACIFSEFGTKVTIVEALERILPTVDEEIAKKFEVTLKKKNIKVLSATKVISVEIKPGALKAALSSGETLEAEKALVSVGRAANTDGLGLDVIGVKLERGNIAVNEKMETSVSGIYAIGDAVGKSMLAHVASYEGKIAAENISGNSVSADYRAVPACIFTRPEIASVGISEQAAKAAGTEIKIGRFQYTGLGKSHIIGDTEGLFKVISDKKDGRILGAAIMGHGASDLIQELTVAVKLGLKSDELAWTIHPHPTLTEGINEAVEAEDKKAIHSL